MNSTLTQDIYLTVASTPAKPGAAAVITVIIEPLVSWIWIGGGLMLGGCVLSAWPSRRRRKNAPVMPGEGEGRDEALVAGSVGSPV